MNPIVRNAAALVVLMLTTAPLVPLPAQAASIGQAAFNATSCTPTYMDMNAPAKQIGDPDLTHGKTILKFRLYYSDCGYANEVYVGLRAGMYPTPGRKLACAHIHSARVNLGSIGGRNLAAFTVPCKPGGASVRRNVTPVRLTASSDRQANATVDIDLRNLTRDYHGLYVLPGIPK